MRKIELTGLSKEGNGGGEKGEGIFLRTDRQANGRTIQRILGKSGPGHFYQTRVRSLAMLVTHSLTESLIHSVTFRKLD